MEIKEERREGEEVKMRRLEGGRKRRRGRRSRNGQKPDWNNGK